MKKTLRRHTISFVHAYDGIKWVLTTQPNFRIHLFISFLVLVAAMWLQIRFIEITVLVFAIILGLTMEMINTAIESMTDLITREYRQEAKIAKDVSAGMMLTTAIGCAVVALYIFFPYVYSAIIH